MANQFNGVETTAMASSLTLLIRRNRRRGETFFAASGSGRRARPPSARQALAEPALRPQTNMDVAILEFALNLEYLEAEFYCAPHSAMGFVPALLGPNPGPVTGGQMVSFTSPLVKAYAREIADEETKHVEFIRAALAKLNRLPRNIVPRDRFHG